MAISLNDEKLTGLILASMSNVRPEGFLLCDGSDILRSQFSSLFSIAPSITSIVTMTTPASPCVVTWTSHGLATGQSIQFTTSGALPTFSTVQTVYFIRVIDTNTFHLYTTLSNAMNTGATTGRINTSGTQSGTHTALVYYWGNGNGTTTFNIPDGRGVVLRGSGTSSGYITNPILTIGSKIDDAIQLISGSLTHVSGISVFEPGSALSSSNSLTGSNNVSYASLGSSGSSASYPYTISINSSVQTRTATENRVKSISVNYYIKF